MTQYIPKSTLVAEIERLREELQDKVETSDFVAGEVFIMNYFLSFFDTLEVKEAVDAEIVEVEDNNNSIYAYTHLEICTDEDLSKICKAGDKAKVIIIKQK